MKRAIIGITLTLIPLWVQAETCPTIQDIKSNNIKGWQIHDIDDEKALTPVRTAYFVKNIDRFVLAEWTDAKDKKEGGTIHCYYHDKNGGSLDAYLIKSNFVPSKTNNYWYPVTGFMRCAADTNKCLFEKAKMESATLAQK